MEEIKIFEYWDPEEGGWSPGGFYYPPEEEEEEEESAVSRLADYIHSLETRISFLESENIQYFRIVLYTETLAIMVLVGESEKAEVHARKILDLIDGLKRRDDEN